MIEPLLFTDEQLDYLRELVNIGGGNAAQAMEQMLHIPVKKQRHEVNIYSLEQARPLIEQSSRIESCVYSRMHGDIDGQAFFLLPEYDYAVVTQAMRAATPLPEGNEISDMDILVEFGNIILGSYFTALQTICQLDISYTQPIAAVDMHLALLDEAISRQAQDMSHIVAIRNEFSLGDIVTSLLLIVPDKKGLQALATSLTRARAVLIDDV